MKFLTLSIAVNRHLFSKLRRIFGLSVSVAVITILYSKLDFKELRSVWLSFDPIDFLYVIGTFLLIYLLSALRWKIMVNPYQGLSLFQSMKLIGFASSLNIALPSKMGSFIKAYELFSDGGVKSKPAVSIVIYEKLLDITAMGVIFLIFTLYGNKYNVLILFNISLSAFIILFLIVIHKIPSFRPDKNCTGTRSWIWDKLVETLSVIITYAQSRELRQAGIMNLCIITMFIWIVHSIQIILFFKMIGLHVPFVTILSHMYCAIFVGLIPVTVAGIGTRDLAIVYLFSGILTYNESLSVGIVSIMRYIVPMILGFPFFLIYVFSKDRNMPIPSYPQRT